MVKDMKNERGRFKVRKMRRERELEMSQRAGKTERNVRLRGNSRSAGFMAAVRLGRHPMGWGSRLSILGTG